MSRSFDHLVVAAYRGRAATDLADAPPDALLGVSSEDARRLADAFGITTIRRLATHPLFIAARTITGAATATRAFDPGPPPAWAARFDNAPLDAYQARPDLFRIDFAPVYYRGWLDGTARLLVVGQDPSVNEILAQRVFVGQSGQRLQGLLAKAGITRSYLMLNTFLYSIFGQFPGPVAALSRQDPILGHRNALFDLAADTNPLQAILTVGNGARDAVDHWPGADSLPRIHVLHPAFPNTTQLLADWNQALADLQAAVEPDDGVIPAGPYGTAFLPDEVVPIPAADLPFGLPSWHGNQDHARRNGNTIIEWHAQPV